MKSESIRVALIGEQGSGKTCFIAGLRWLGDGNHLSRFTNLAALGESKRYLDGLTDALYGGCVPAATASTHHLAFEEIFRDGRNARRVLSFDVADYRGGEIGEIDADAELFKVWADCDFLALMLDVDSEGRCPRAKDLSHLFDVIANRKMINRGKHLCFLLTKADRHGCSVMAHDAEAARDFLRSRFAALVVKVEDVLGFRDWSAFYVASLGVEPTVRETDAGKKVAVVPPEGIRPFGYDEVCDWIVATSGRARRKRRFRKFRGWIVLGALALAVGAAALVSRHVGFVEARRIAENPKSSRLEQAEATHQMSANGREKFLDGRLDRYAQALAAAEAPERIRALMKDEAVFFDVADLSEEQRMRRGELDARARSRCRELEEKLEQTRREELRARLASLVIADTEDAVRLREKLELVETFPYADEGERQEAKKAVEVVRKILETDVYTLTAARAGELDGNQRTYLLLASGDSCEISDLGEQKDTLPHTDSLNEAMPVWDSFAGGGLKWRPGQRIAVEWRRNAWFGVGDTALARTVLPGDHLTILRLCGDKVVLAANGEEEGLLKDVAWVQVSCKELPEAEQALPLVRKYVLPGKYWSRRQEDGP